KKGEILKVVVSASRISEEKVSPSLAQSVSVVSRKEIDEEVYADIDDALRKVAGVGLAPAEGNPNFWQEGFTIRGLGAQRVLTLTDGVRQAGQGIGYGGGNLSLYDTYGVERIEVIKGPASVLYGTDAFGGVINVVTRKPARRREFGINGAFKYSFDASRELNRGGGYFDFGDLNYGVILGASYTDSQEPNLPDGEDARSGSFRNGGLWANTFFNLSSKSTLKLTANLDRNKDILIEDTVLPLPIATFPPPGNSQLIFSPLFFKIPTYARYFLKSELDFNKPFLNWEKAIISLSWQRISRKFHRETAFYPTGSPGFSGPPLFFDPSATVTTSVIDTDDTTDTIELQPRAQVSLGKHTLVFGSDLGLDIADQSEVEQQTVVAVAGVGAVSGGAVKRFSRQRVDANQVRLGFYLRDKYSLSKVDIIPGIRIDYFRVDDNNTSFNDSEVGLSGSLGAIYGYTKDDSIYINLASGFRAPDLGERFQNGIVNLGVPSRIIGKANLDSERSWSAEFGTKHSYKKFTLDSAVYYNLVQDFIGTKDLGFKDGFATQQFDNLGTVALYGVEGSAKYRPFFNLEIYFNFDRTWTTKSDKVDVRNWAFNYGVSHKMNVDNDILNGVKTALNFRTVLKSTDNTPSPGRQRFEAGSFTVADLVISADLFSRTQSGAKVVGGVKNLFNRKYQEPFFPRNQPERSAFISLEYYF
ncbi:MAG: TonB-dependent receptor, partial [Candidatus Dadabacteria bacterium]